MIRENNQYSCLCAVPLELVHRSQYVTTSITSKIRYRANLGLLTSDIGLNATQVQKFIHSNDQHYDLVLQEQSYQESWLMFAHKFNAPIVSICELMDLI